MRFFSERKPQRQFFSKPARTSDPEDAIDDELVEPDVGRQGIQNHAASGRKRLESPLVHPPTPAQQNRVDAMGAAELGTRVQRVTTIAARPNEQEDPAPVRRLAHRASSHRNHVRSLAHELIGCQLDVDKLLFRFADLGNRIDVGHVPECS